MHSKNMLLINILKASKQSTKCENLGKLRQNGETKVIISQIKGIIGDTSKISEDNLRISLLNQIIQDFSNICTYM